MVYLANPQTAGVLDDQNKWWTTPVIDTPTWSTDGSRILFGRYRGNLIRIDTAARTIEVGDPITSLAVSGGKLWLTTTASDGSTMVSRRDFSTTAYLNLVLGLAETWTFLPTNPGLLVLRATKTGEGVKIVNRSGLGYTTKSLGIINRVLSDRSNQPLVWTDGLEVNYLDPKNQPQLIDRLAKGVVWAEWFHSPDVMAISDGSQVTVYSIATNTVIKIIARQSLPTGARIISQLPTGNGFWYQANNQVWRWSW
jgi:hypothetical protein